MTFTWLEILYLFLLDRAKVERLNELERQFTQMRIRESEREENYE